MKKVLIIEPGVFYEFISSNSNIFNSNNIYSFISLLDLESENNLFSFLSEYDEIYIDDYTSNSKDVNLLKDKLVKYNIRFFSLVEFYEDKLKHSAFFLFEGKYYFPYYLKELKPNLKYFHLLRIVDLFFCILFLPIVLLILLISGLILFVFSGSPILFKQTRVGKNGKLFTLFKLRTMTKDHNMSPTKINDSRIFPLGLFFRKFKIDELPQIFNILFGHMSIFGPRPERFDINTKICQFLPEFKSRLLVRPGLTGWAQIYNPIATPDESFEKLQYDVFFIKNISFKMIYIIILKTINILITKKSL